MQPIIERLARRAQGRAPSPIRELLPLMRLPGMISLGGGYPNPETFVFGQVEVRFKSGTAVVLAGRELDEASQYGASEGYPPLRGALREWQRHKDGVTLNDDQLVLLNGSQEGLFIAAYLFLEADDSVVVTEPDYPGALSAFGAFCKHTHAVPLDAAGLDTDALAALLGRLRQSGARMPKLLYCVPNGHNPGGVSLSLPRRQALAALAREHDLLILEDDPYQLVRLDDAPTLPTLQSLAFERVIRLDSFSKIFAPGLRLGYASGPAEVVRQFVLFKQAANLHTSSLTQVVLERFLGEVGGAGFCAEIERNCALYRRNRDAMVAAAQELLARDVTFNVPRAGMFLWFELPRGFDAKRMLEVDTRDQLVILVPGPAFSTQGGLRHCLRASFSLVGPAEIREGIRRFATMVERERGRLPGGSAGAHP